MQALSIRRLTVKPDRIEAVVMVSDKAYAFTTPQLVQACVAAFPNLPGHACHNECGPTFGAVMDHTGLPHLLEHLVIDISAQAAFASAEQAIIAVSQKAKQAAYSRPACANGSRSVLANEPYSSSLARASESHRDFIFTGTTQWDETVPLQALVSVSYQDDVTCLKAFKRAQEFINATLNEE